MRLFAFITVLIIAAGAGLSVLLIPRDNELGLIYLKHGEHKKAIEIYEAKIKAGDISVSVVSPAVDVYLHTGRVEDAIRLLERFVEAHPRDLVALNRLASLYQDALRPHDQVRTLEKIVAVKPNDTDLRQIAAHYWREARFKEWAETVRKIIAAFPDEPKDFIRLARWEARNGRKARAVQILQQFEHFHFEQMSAGNLELMLSLLTDVGRRDQAFERAQYWLEKQGSPETALRIALVFQHRKDHDLAVKLLLPFAADGAKIPELLSTLTRLELALGQNAAAYKRLTKYYDAKTLPPALDPLLIELALSRGDTKRALQVAGDARLDALTDSQLLALARAARAKGQTSFIRKIMARLGSRRLAARPVLAATLSMVSGDIEQSRRWVAAAEKSPKLATEQMVALASLYERLGRSADALAVLEKAISTDDSEGSELMQLAGLYIQVKRVEDGRALFARLRASRKSAWAHLAWALLESAAGNAAGAAAWLEKAPVAAVNRVGLETLFEQALRQKQKLLAVAAAERLYKLDPNDVETRLVLARARTAAGQAEKALPVLKAMLPGNSDVQTAYLAALAAVARKGAAPEKDLHAAFRARLEDPNLTEQARTDLIYAMIDSGGFSLVLPELERLVKEQGGDWIFAYETALQKLGRKGELRAFWAKQLARTKIPDADRRAIGYRMLEAGEKKLAAGVFRTLSEKAPPEAPDVAQLIDIWGKAATMDEVAWVEARARTARGRERAKWFEHLISLGAAKRAIAIAEEDPSQLRDGPVMAAYMDALARTKQKQRLGKLLQGQLERTRDTGTLRQLARVAWSESNYGAATRAYTRILSTNPRDKEALKRIGHIAYWRDRCGETKTMLARYFAAGGGDHESYYYMGECLTRSSQWQAATPYYQRALRAAGRGGGTSARLVRAKALYRLGRFEESVSAFERLLRASPRSKSVREDYIAVLSALGRYDRAKQIRR